MIDSEGMSSEDSLCDALLQVYGLPGNEWGNWEGSLTEARNRVRPAARSIMTDLSDDGFKISPDFLPFRVPDSAPSTHTTTD